MLRAPGQVLGAPSVFKCVREISLIFVCIYILVAKSESTGKYELFQGWSWTGPGLREEIESCLRYYNMWLYVFYVFIVAHFVERKLIFIHCGTGTIRLPGVNAKDLINLPVWLMIFVWQAHFVNPSFIYSRIFFSYEDNTHCIETYYFYLAATSKNNHFWYLPQSNCISFTGCKLEPEWLSGLSSLIEDHAFTDISQS